MSRLKSTAAKERDLCLERRGKEDGSPSSIEGDYMVVDTKSPRRIEAQAFVEDRAPNIVFAGGTWLDYTGTHYREVSEQRIRDMLYAYCQTAKDERGNSLARLADAEFITNMVGAVRSLVSRGEMANFLGPSWLSLRNGDPRAADVVSFRNGLLDMTTRKLYPHTPRFYTRTSLDFDYVDDVLSEYEPTLWLSTLGEWFEHDQVSIDLLQEVFGYIISQNTSLQNLFVIVGPSRSNAGLILDLLKAVLGRANVTNASLSGLLTDWGAAHLTGKSLLTVSDPHLSGKGRNKIEKVLNVVSHDSVRANCKLTGRDAGRKSRIVMLCNEKFRLSNTSGAALEHVIPVTMTKSSYGFEHKDLLTKLIPEMPGIINWALDGRDRLAARGRFEPPSSSQARAGQDRQSSSVRRFLRECCDVAPQHKIVKSRLFRAYQSWAAAHQVPAPMFANTFPRALKIVSGDNMATRRITGGDGKRYWCIVGVRLKDDIVRQLLDEAKTEYEEHADRF